MFERIHIQNFLSCQDVVIDDMRGFTALVGRNGSGKTNILRAIQWAVESATSTQPIKSALMIPATVGFVLVLDKTRFRYQLEVTLITQEPDNTHKTYINEKLEIQTPSGEWQNLVFRQGDTIRISGHDTDIQTGIAMPSLPALEALMPQKPVVKPVSSVINFFNAVRYYPLDEPNLPNMEIGSNGYVKHLDYIEWLNKYNSRPEPNSSVIMRLLHLSLEKPETYEALKTLLGANGLELIEDIHIISQSFPIERRDKSNAFYVIEFLPSANRGTLTQNYFTYQELSFGTRRLLRLLVSVIYDKSAMLLLEQPEDGIHVGLLHKLVPLLKTYSDQGQFLIASHSSEVFNRLEPQEIRLVTMVNGVTHLRPFDDIEITEAKSLDFLGRCPRLY
jgi:predicted ATPase